ncbi:MAG: hypothetical protein KatS3mg008_1438 [Acidimicrobiales bacterium]|nr:MAG: hypothetical protein KatS3mg008_1438 [Acidimicrobiales bacterium]
MAKKKTKNKDNAKKAKKRVSVLTQENVQYVDYKDVNLLRRFMSERAKIRARRVTGNSAQQQREVAKAIKNAREMALLPYTNRITQTRTPGGAKVVAAITAAGPPPLPSTPPPGPVPDISRVPEQLSESGDGSDSGSAADTVAGSAEEDAQV